MFLKKGLKHINFEIYITFVEGKVIKTFSLCQTNFFI